MPNNLKIVDKKLAQLNSKRPLPQATLNSLRENWLVEWTYNSNAIEGNTLTLKETKVVLEGITVGGKTISEHLEAINHKEAILYIEELILEPKSLIERDIKNIHYLVLKQIDTHNAGKYRNIDVLISGASHIPPRSIVVHQLMSQLMVDLDKWTQKQHQLVVCALLHGEFVKIHPFVDGNGRTARLLMNFVAIKNGYPPIVIAKEQRLKYYDALDTAHTTNDYTSLVAMIFELAEKSLDKYLSVL